MSRQKYLNKFFFRIAGPKKNVKPSLIPYPYSTFRLLDSSNSSPFLSAYKTVLSPRQSLSKNWVHYFKWISAAALTITATPLKMIFSHDLIPNPTPTYNYYNREVGFSPLTHKKLYAFSLATAEQININSINSILTESKILSVHSHLGLVRRLKRLNLVKKDRFRNYYTFYSYYISTTPDQLSYSRVMLPSFRESARGVFWSRRSYVSNNDTNLSLAPFHRLSRQYNPFKVRAYKHPYPALNSLRQALKYKINRRTRSGVKNLTRSPLFRSKIPSHQVTSKYRRRLFRVSRRLPGYLGFIRRRWSRRLRRVNRLRFRLFRLCQRSGKRKSVKSGKSVSRQPALLALKRRSSRLRVRRFALPKHLSSKSHVALLSSNSELRLGISTLKALRSQLLRPLYRSLLRLTSHIHNLPALSGVDRFKDLNTQEKVVFSPSPFILADQLNSTASLFFSSLGCQTSPTSIKYLLSKRASGSYSGYYEIRSLVSKVQHQVYSYEKNISSRQFRSSNLTTLNSVNYVIRRKFLRLISSNAFSVDLSFWYYKTLLQFIENCSGRKALLNFGPFVENSLTFEDRARCTLWNNRVTGFQRIMGHRIFVYEALSIVAIAIRLKDPTFLSNWIRGMLKRLSFWRYRLIFRYLKFLLRHIFKPNFHLFGFRGVKLSLKGKISVAGNARTRTLFLRVGDTSHSKMDNKVSYDLSLVNTFTGVLGFKLFFYY